MIDQNRLDIQVWLSSIIESAEDPVFSITLDGIMQSWNPAASKMLGFSESEIVGHHIEKIIPKEFQHNQTLIFEKIKDGQRILHYETYLRNKEGKDLSVALSISPIRDKFTHIIGASVLVRDMNALMDSEKKKAMLAAIIDSSDDAIIGKDLNGTITSWNKSAERIFGYTEEEAVGKHIFLIIPEDHRNEESYIIGQIREGKKVNHFETVRKAKDGRLVPLSITVSPIKDSSGKIIGASKIARPLEQQQIAEEKQAILAAIVESSDDAIISKNLNGIITSWNRGAEEILGFTESEMIGSSILKIIPDDRKEEEAQIIARIKSGEKLDHFETIRKRKDGTHINVSITVSPIISKGKVIGASKILRDVTNRIEIEKQLQEQKEKLEELNRAKDEFIGIASHELKTPLTSIKAYLQLMERISADAKNKLYVSKTLGFVSKLESLVSDLLDVSKIQAGKLSILMEPCSLNMCIMNAIESVQHTTASHQITFKTKVEGIMIYADCNRIEQVVINLLTNAIKYSPSADLVQVTSWSDESNGYVEVRDFGIGIPEDQQKKIFERFYRAEGSPAQISGLGIGLFITQEIVRRHKGRIWVESEPGKGSGFFVSIPLAR